MKRPLAALLTTAIVTASFCTNAIAQCEQAASETKATPQFLIGFVPEKDGSRLTPVVYQYDKAKGLTEVAAHNMVPFDVKGKRCSTTSVAVTRFWNHDLYFTISIGELEWKIPIPHPH